MTEYQLSDAEKAAVPARYATEPRYLGYREADYQKPYAHYFSEKVIPVQPHVPEAIIAGPVAGGFGPRLSRLADEMSKPGYQHLETGYTVNDDGHLVVCVLTDMPGVTPEMWDWWVWWHAVETARYKLWHPESHVSAIFSDDRSQIKGLTDRQRFIGNCSFINEYLGADLANIKASIIDSEKLGFDMSKPSETWSTSRGGPIEVPIAGLWIIHQIRATPTGSEMRTRFFANDVRVLPTTARSVTSVAGKVMTLPVVNQVADMVISRTKPMKLHEFGPALLMHGAQEMNHLASFLPQIYNEFAADSRR